MHYIIGITVYLVLLAIAKIKKPNGRFTDSELN